MVVSRKRWALNTKTATGQKMRCLWSETAEILLPGSQGSTRTQKRSVIVFKLLNPVSLPSTQVRAPLNASIVKEVYYPKCSSTRPFYDQYRTSTGGYGGLLSVTFRSKPEAIAFYDALETAKGPSLGTNFTLRSV